MSALSALTRTQFKVFLREPLAVFFGLVFPAVLLVVIGVAYPGATDPDPTFDGRSLVEVYTPTTIVLGMATMAVFLLPVALGGDRERGSSAGCRRRRLIPGRWSPLTSPCS